jgi:hypothetical protein
MQSSCFRWYDRGEQRREEWVGAYLAPFFAAFFRLPLPVSFSFALLFISFPSLSVSFRAFFCLPLLSSDDLARLRAFSVGSFFRALALVPDLVVRMS